MSIVGLLETLIIIGVVLYFINNIIPMDAKVKKIVNIIVIALAAIWLVDTFAYDFGHISYKV